MTELQATRVRSYKVLNHSIWKDLEVSKPTVNHKIAIKYDPEIHMVWELDEEGIDDPEANIALLTIVDLPHSLIETIRNHKEVIISLMHNEYYYKCHSVYKVINPITKRQNTIVVTAIASTKQDV